MKAHAGTSPASKLSRQKAIMKLISSGVVRTQQDIVTALRSQNFDATQGTVSRDIRELGLVRTADSGGLRYVSGSGESVETVPEATVGGVIREYARTVEFISQLGVIKGRPSSAPLVAAAIDAAGYDEVAGTVAGDDTVFVLARSRAAAIRLKQRFESFLGIGG